MFNVATGFIVGIGVFAMRMYDIHKNKKELKKLLETREYSLYKFNTILMYSMFLLIIPSLLSIYWGYLEGSDTNIGLGILLVFLFLAEGINAIDITKLYYTEHGAIINNKFIRFKNMKSVKRKYAIPFSKHVLATYQNEKITINEPVSKFLQDKGIPIVQKQD